MSERPSRRSSFPPRGSVSTWDHASSYATIVSNWKAAVHRDGTANTLTQLVQARVCDAMIKPNRTLRADVLSKVFALILKPFLLAVVLIEVPFANIVGVRRRADLRMLKNLRPLGLSLEDAIAERYRIRRWKAFHRDSAHRTRITCEVVDTSGRLLLLGWELGHQWSPHPIFHAKEVFIFPLSRASAEFGPTFSEFKLRPSDFPEYPTWSSQAICARIVARSNSARRDP